MSEPAPGRHDPPGHDPPDTTGGDAPRAPWWASVGPDGLDDEDPLAAHRSARRGPWADHAATGARARWDHGRPWDTPRDERDRHGGHGQHHEHARHGGHDERHGRDGRGAAVEDVLAGLGAVARAAARRAGSGRTGGPRPGPWAAPPDHDPTCRTCPWCVLTRSLADARPEVTAHLEQAARHLVAAARAWVDAAEERTDYESIPVDDEEDRS